MALQDIHPEDKSVRNSVAVPDSCVGEEIARPRVVDDLVHVDSDAAVGLLGEALGFDAAGDGGELTGPVVAHRRAADDPAALPGVRPIDIRVHELDSCVDVTRVECRVGGSEEGLQRVHAHPFILRLRGELRAWDAGADGGSEPGFGVDVESAVDRGQAVGETAQAGAEIDVGAAYAVVADLDREAAARLRHRH